MAQSPSLTRAPNGATVRSRGGVGEPVAGVDYGPLAEWLGFHLRMAQIASFQAFAAEVGEVDLAPGRFALLTLIGRNPGISQTVLSRAAGRDKSTLTPALRDLTKRGLIVCERLAKDRRSYHLSLTPAGQEMLRAPDAVRRPSRAQPRPRRRCARPGQAAAPAAQDHVGARVMLCSRQSGAVVIPGLVPGIHLSASAGAIGTLDQGDEHRDDKLGAARWLRFRSTRRSRACIWAPATRSTARASWP